MKRYISLLLLALMSLLQACAPKSQSSCGFVQNVYGERVSWKGELPIKMVLHESIPEEMVPAIKRAAATWNKVAGKTLISMDFTQRDNGPRVPRKDGLNVIYLMDTWEAEKSSEQGRTSVYSIGDQIKETDVRLNGSGDFKFHWETDEGLKSNSNSLVLGNSVNMEALVLHEFGHVLGLKHRYNEGSVMATYLSFQENRVDLAANDTLSLKCEY